MFPVLVSVFLPFLVALAVTYFVMPFIIGRMSFRRIYGIDMNKAHKPKVAEMGGIGVWLGLTSGILAAIFFFSYLNDFAINLTVLLAGLCTIMIIAFLGVIDDLVGWRQGIKQWQHALVPVFAALPLMAVKVSNPPITLPFIGILPGEFLIPFFGIVSFGAIYSLLLVPAGVTGASNATNMLAGLNGLEAGLGVLIATVLLAVSAMEGKVEAALIAASMLGALLAFLRFNWFPAKIFGGDSLTLLIGAGIATIVIIGNFEMIGVMLMPLYFVELVLKGKHKMQLDGFGIPTKEGILMAPKKAASLTHLVMRMGRFNEKQVVLVIIGMQAVISVIVFGIYYFKLFGFLI